MLSTQTIFKSQIKTKCRQSLNFSLSQWAIAARILEFPPVLIWSATHEEQCHCHVPWSTCAWERKGSLSWVVPSIPSSQKHLQNYENMDGLSCEVSHTYRGTSSKTKGWGWVSRVIDGKSVWLQWQSARQLPQYHCSCNTGLSCWSLVSCTALDKSFVCFLHWLMSKIGRPLAHYKGEIRKITLLDVLAPWQQDCTSTRRW